MKCLWLSFFWASSSCRLTQSWVCKWHRDRCHWRHCRQYGWLNLGWNEDESEQHTLAPSQCLTLSQHHAKLRQLDFKGGLRSQVQSPRFGKPDWLVWLVEVWQKIWQLAICLQFLEHLKDHLNLQGTSAGHTLLACRVVVRCLLAKIFRGNFARLN